MVFLEGVLVVWAARVEDAQVRRLRERAALLVQ